MGFQLPAFTPSLILKIVSITGAFLRGVDSVLGRVGAMQSDLISQINPVTYTALQWQLSQSLDSHCSTESTCVFQLLFSHLQQQVWGMKSSPFTKTQIMQLPYTNRGVTLVNKAGPMLVPQTRIVPGKVPLTQYPRLNRTVR